MTGLPDPGTDPIVEPRIGFLGRLFGIDKVVDLINERFDDLEALLTANAADTAALEAARATLTVADQAIDNIERT